MTGQDLVDIAASPPSIITELAQSALKPGTRAAHRRAIKSLGNMSIALQHARAAKAIIMFLSRIRTSRRWRWSTMAKNMATMQGALKKLPLYVQGAPVDLALDPEWVAACKSAQAKAKSEAARVPLAASMAWMEAAILAAPDMQMKILLMLAWCVAARIGDLLKLKIGSNQCPDVVCKNGVLSITWRDGKTVSSRGPYTVAVRPPSEWYNAIAAYLRTRTTWVFSGLKTGDVLVALRRAHPKLECRSVRRGALQCLANAGVSDSVLMQISGHTQLQTLKRYLQWGKIGLLALGQMTEASMRMFGTATTTTHG